MTAHAHTLAATDTAVHKAAHDAHRPAIDPAISPGSPMTTSPPREAKFWDKAAAKYARSPIADQAAYERKLEVTRQYLGQDMNVLEFGCGTGSTALLHAPYVKHILATDFSAKMIEIAQAKLPGSEIDNVTFATGTLDDLDVPAGSFDAVMAMSVLHLLADPKAAMTRVHDLLKPGGVFISSTACIADMSLPIRLALPAGRLFGLVPLVAAFTEKQLIENVMASGFAIEHHWKPGKGKAVFVVARKQE